MENKQTAVQNFWDKIALKLTIDQVNEFLPEFEIAKQIEADIEFETKQYWFGRGVLAGKEDRIAELKPKYNGE